MATEQEYIQIGDQRSISTALNIMRDLVPENNDAVPVDENKTVVSLIS